MGHHKRLSWRTNIFITRERRGEERRGEERRGEQVEQTHMEYTIWRGAEMHTTYHDIPERDKETQKRARRW
jgi:hypothetical protein